jgi:hypothetical protein
MVQCEYAGKESETRQQTLKRKHEEFSRLYEFIKNEDESEALQIVHRIRTHQDIGEILAHCDSEKEHPGKRRSRQFLTTLIQTTAPLPDLIRLASLVLLQSQSGLKLPELTAYEPLRDCVITIETLIGVLALDNPGVPILTLENSISPIHTADGFNGSPPHWVSVASWTQLTKSDDVLSHLVSTFLALVNGYWRFLEQDLFLKAVRMGGSSELCSPFLVNAILACASVSDPIRRNLPNPNTSKLYTEIDEVFTTPGRPLTRGRDFHKEAMRLRMLYMSRPSIATIQALFILAME